MKSGKQRRGELKTKRKQREAKQQSVTTGQPTLRPSGTAPVNEDLLAPYKSYGALVMLCAVTIKTYPFAARVVVRRRLGQPRSKNGGMKWRRAMFILRRSSAVHAARRHKHDARR
jgi:hypothetical protein